MFPTCLINWLVMLKVMNLLFTKKTVNHMESSTEDFKPKPRSQGLSTRMIPEGKLMVIDFD